MKLNYRIRPEEFSDLLKNSRENMDSLYSADPIELSDDDVISSLQNSCR